MKISLCTLGRAARLADLSLAALAGCAAPDSDEAGAAASESEIVTQKFDRFSVWYDVYYAGSGRYRLRGNVRGMTDGDAVERAGVFSYYNPCVLHYGAAFPGCRDPFEAEGPERAAAEGASLLAPWSSGDPSAMRDIRWLDERQFELLLDPADTTGEAADHWKALAKPLTIVIPIVNGVTGQRWTLGMTAVLRAIAQAELKDASGETRLTVGLSTSLDNYRGAAGAPQILVNTYGVDESSELDLPDWSLTIDGESYEGGGCGHVPYCRGYQLSTAYAPLEGAADIAAPVRALFRPGTGDAVVHARGPGGLDLSGDVQTTAPDGAVRHQAEIATSSVALWGRRL